MIQICDIPLVLWSSNYSFTELLGMPCLLKDTVRCLALPAQEEVVIQVQYSRAALL